MMMMMMRRRRIIAVMMIMRRSMMANIVKATERSARSRSSADTEYFRVS